MRIGELSEISGVSRDALRMYEARGLLRSTRSANGYRDFLKGSDQLVGYIKTAQALGFTLAEISEDMPAMTMGGLPANEVEVILRRKLGEIDARLTGLAELRAQLAARLEQVCPLTLI